MDYIGFLVIGVIVFLSALFALICGVGYIKKTFFFEDLVEEILKNLANDEEMQKNLFIVGGMLGNGLKGGMGLPSTKSRTNLKGIIMDLVGQFIQAKVGDAIANPLPSPQPQPSPNTQDSKSRKLSDKW
jgi:hypothetical protein